MWKAFLIAALLFASPAWGNSADEVRDLITAGDYETARQIAQNLDTAEGYALAAESLSAQILLGEVSKLNKKSKEARELSEKALALDPSLYNAKLQYALADGFVTRTSGDITAWRKKLPSKTLAKIQGFRAAYPEDPKGLALEGAWHLGVIRKTGEKNGGKWFGASLAEGERLYAEARAAAPNDVLIETNYALSLLVLDVEAYGPQVAPILEAVATMPANDDLYRKVQSKAAKVLAAYVDDKRVKKLAEWFLDGEPLE
ncbi:hypothetical protein [Hellea balneolensis]|uniref:hypothetical protein n=1 Tax=Hellea balneolensis TaxID=287478 RepID=UPI0004147B05|nr:hypothetical protein [Hellea balneolensis]